MNHSSGFGAVFAWLSGLDSGVCFALVIAGCVLFALYIALRIAVGRPVEWSRDRDLHNNYGAGGGLGDGGAGPELFDSSGSDCDGGSDGGGDGGGD